MSTTRGVSGDISGGGCLDTLWGDAGSAIWRVHIRCEETGPACQPSATQPSASASTRTGESQHTMANRALCIELHEPGSAHSGFLACVMGAKGWHGDTELTLPYAAWLPCITPLLRCLYAPDAADMFVEQLLYRRSLSEALSACHCALYFDLGVRFFRAFYCKARSRRNLLTRNLTCSDVDSDEFQFPQHDAAAASWFSLPLEHALWWLHALQLTPAALQHNLETYVSYCCPALHMTDVSTFLDEKLTSLGAITHAQNPTNFLLDSGVEHCEAERMASEVHAWKSLHQKCGRLRPSSTVPPLEGVALAVPAP